MKYEKCYQNEPKCNNVSSWKNSLKIKDEVYIINPNEYELIGTHRIALYVVTENVT